jgi:hypothetical protein
MSDLPSSPMAWNAAWICSLMQPRPLPAQIGGERLHGGLAAALPDPRDPYCTSAMPCARR